MAPKPYAVSRTILISAPMPKVHGLINDFHRWVAWSPWEGIDPNVRRDYSGAERGPGAHYRWAGNKKAGQGSMVITDSSPERIAVDLRFDKPFPADNAIVFDLVPSADQTQVTWTMTGQVSGVMKLFASIKSMDAFLGPDFEKGLAQLKQVAEA